MKFLTLITLLSLLLTIQFLPAQAPDTLWTRTYGGSGNDAGNAIQRTSDGGYIIVGYTESFGAGGRDVWLIKTDAFGDTLWTKTFGGSDWDEGNSVQQTTDGGYIITGYISTFSPGIRNVWLIKTDPAGDTLWTKSFGGVESDWGNFVQQTSDGGYVVVGATRSFSVGLSDVWLIKTDNLGDTLWTKTFGDSLDDWGYSVQQTSDTGYVYVVTTSSFGASIYDVWLVKTDANGDTSWTRIFAGSNVESSRSVKQTSDGGYIVAVTTSSFGAGLRDLWLIKTDVSGHTLWTKTYGYYLSEYIYDVQQTADDGYVFVGGTCSFSSGAIWDLWLIKTDATGYPHWTRTLGGNSADEGHCLQQTSDGGYIITGYTSSFGAGGDDVWLVICSAATRSDAFAACAWIVDEVKKEQLIGLRELPF